MDNNSQLDLAVIEYLDTKKKKIVFKQTDGGMELYVTDLEEKKDD